MNQKLTKKSLKIKREKIKFFFELKFLRINFDTDNNLATSTERLNLLQSQGWGIYNTFVFENYVIYELGKAKKIE